MTNTTSKRIPNHTTPSIRPTFPSTTSAISLPPLFPPIKTLGEFHSNQIGNSSVHFDGFFEARVGNSDGGMAHFVGHVGGMED
jgi:hypothetical protein